MPNENFKRNSDICNCISELTCKFQDEYEKKQDFYDEYHEDGGSEKHGGWHEEHEGKKGGHEKKGHLHAGHHEVVIY